jgi:hypothetical protein
VKQQAERKALTYKKFAGGFQFKHFNLVKSEILGQTKDILAVRSIVIFTLRMTADTQHGKLA